MVTALIRPAGTDAGQNLSKRQGMRQNRAMSPGNSQVVAFVGWKGTFGFITIGFQSPGRVTMT
jgi:hypothetical protein